MIRRYNRNQIILGILAILGGLVCSFLAFLFFRYLPAYAMDRFGFEVSKSTAMTIGLVGLIVLFSSAFSVWKKGGGLTSVGESALYFEALATSESGAAFEVNRRLGQVTGTSHALSQLFLADPMMLFNAATRFKSLIPMNVTTEERMSQILTKLRSIDKWQNLEEHQGWEKEIRHLIQIGAVDFGVPKGVPKIKANSDYGN